MLSLHDRPALCRAAAFLLGCGWCLAHGAVVNAQLIEDVPAARMQPRTLERSPTIYEAPAHSSSPYQHNPTDGDAFEEPEFEIPGVISLDELKDIDGRTSGFVPELTTLPRRPRYNIYREHASIWSWMPGDGNQFGWTDFETTPYIGRDQRSGITTSVGLHLLSGPISVALPPRLWDFAIGYQLRESLSDFFSYDLAANVGVYSDFEDSARDGVRTLGHAVGMVHVNPTLDLVAGIDYLDRDDYMMLPVIGYSWHSANHPNFQVDMVFPRPRVQLALNPTNRIYTAGLLGGGQWDIEMPGEQNNVMTYRDFRWLFGHEHLTDQGNVTALELGWVFGRKVEFRDNGLPNYDFNDAFIIRWVSTR
ncbi:MAG: DUF6268 family outer membrane beta-barrel protein [Pirellula sp.]